PRMYSTIRHTHLGFHWNSISIRRLVSVSYFFLLRV
ncbi:uncharacterized protein METZ01_LOCUS229421, partial [marine metagenome]